MRRLLFVSACGICLGVGLVAGQIVRGDESLDRKAASRGDWAMGTGDEFNQRFSGLEQINARNVGTLRLAWSVPTDAFRGHKGSPLVVAGTMYVHTPFPNRVTAFDLKTRRIKWRFERAQDLTIVGQMCCDSVSRGLAYGDGKIYLQQADSTLLALDAQTGRVVWDVLNGDPKVGAVNTNAPHVFGDVVVTGIAGGGWGVRGYLTAYALEDGRRVWRGYSTGPDDEMLVEPAHTMTWRDGRMQPVGKGSSLSSWPGEEWRRGGGSTWGWYSYDRRTNTLYYGTGNPGVFNPKQRSGDNRWAASIWARDLATGKARWIYQMTPHDQWDYGGTNEMILADLNLDGRKVPALVHFDRNGFVYVLNRDTGALVSATKYAPEVNWASHVDLRTGRPVVDKRFSTEHHGADVATKGICPSALGVKNQQPAAYHPGKRTFYVPMTHLCMDYEPFEVAYQAGMPYIGAKIVTYPSPTSPQMGGLLAWDAEKRKAVSVKSERYPLWSGVLATAGGLVCYGTLDGDLKCVDASNIQRELWRTRLPSGIVGNVFTYEFAGKQYIGVFSGTSGWPANAIRSSPSSGESAHGQASASELSQLANVGGRLSIYSLPD